jgi:hypothetical protein
MARRPWRGKLRRQREQLRLWQPCGGLGQHQCEWLGQPCGGLGQHQCEWLGQPQCHERLRERKGQELLAKKRSEAVGPYSQRDCDGNAHNTNGSANQQLMLPGRTAADTAQEERHDRRRQQQPERQQKKFIEHCTRKSTGAGRGGGAG